MSEAVGEAIIFCKKTNCGSFSDCILGYGRKFKPDVEIVYVEKRRGSAIHDIKCGNYKVKGK